ncbi:MAG: hypothetical protein U0L94_09815 [Akkermansia sp.]|nr:hypothetical protein [Akkermansia sp.]
MIKAESGGSGHGDGSICRIYLNIKNAFPLWSVQAVVVLPGCAIPDGHALVVRAYPNEALTILGDRIAVERIGEAGFEIHLLPGAIGGQMPDPLVFRDCP